MISENIRPCPRYGHEVLAWEYDQRNKLVAGELEWYLKYAAKAEGPILELACGSGRLLIPIAKAGYEIDGVDIAETMLNRLKDKISTLDRKIQSRIGIYCCDMIQFAPKRQYSLVFVGNNSLQYLETKNRHLACFQRIYEFLKHGGYFLIVTARSDPSKYAGGKKVVIDWMDKPVIDEERGLSVGSKFVSYLEPGRERIVTERTYKIVHRGVNPEIIECVTYTPILSASDYIEMLEQTGFTVKAYGGYEEQPENGISRIMCFVSHKAVINRS